MKNLTPEMIEKAEAAKSAEELLEIAKENGVDMSADEAATFFAQLNPKSGELDDDELDNVAGGACWSKKSAPTLADYTMVRVLTGSSCRTCGGTTGYIYTYGGQSPSISIICTTCQNRGAGTNCVESFPVSVELIEGVHYELI